MNRWRPLANRAWRQQAVPVIVSLAKVTWHQRYQGDVPPIVSFLCGRIEAVVGHGDRDCNVTFSRVSLSDVTAFNPKRQVAAEGGYPQLQKILESNPPYDAVPVTLARHGSRLVIWDGHHRYETYRLAGRTDIPAFIAEFVDGVGYVSAA